MSWNKTSRAGLVFCLASSLMLTGCASSGWNRLLGRGDKPSAKLTLAWSRLKEDEGSLTEARSGYEKVLSEQPNNVDAMMGMARMNVKAQRLVDAEQGYVHALELRPKSSAVLSEVGKFYAQQQRWDRAIPLLQDAQRIEPHEKSHQFTLAVALAQAGRTSEALPHFNEAVGEAAAHYNIGRIMIEAKKTAEAEQQFKLALAKDPSLKDAQYFLQEIQAGRQGPPSSKPILADTGVSSSATQQVGATGQNPADMTTAAMAPLSGRSPLYPHEGYEELPAPPDGDGGFAGVTPAAGFSPAVSAGASYQTGPQLGQQPGGAQFRVNSFQQMGR